jgi:peroxiredoxin
MSHTPKNRWIQAFVAVLVIILAGMIWVNRDRFAPVEIGSKAPDYEVFSLLGDKVKVSDYRGSVVVLNVWETTCGPCVQEMPSLQRLHTALASEGLNVIAISEDLPSDSAAIRKFGERFGLTFPLLHDRSGKMQGLYAVQGFPTTFIIDRKGRIRDRLLGAREWDDPALLEELRKLLGS